MQRKSELRKILKKKRKNIEDKIYSDKRICETLMSSDVYIKSDLILFYSAISDEINIDSCIENALKLKKKVALPVCLNENGDMQFYYINSLKDLKKGYFNISQPDTEIAKPVYDFSNSICIVPAIAYDKNGYRLGYGKGYYDRFLKTYVGKSVGLCYNMLIQDELPTDEHDIPVDYIITEIKNFKVATTQGGKNG